MSGDRRRPDHGFETRRFFWRPPASHLDHNRQQGYRGFHNSQTSDRSNTGHQGGRVITCRSWFGAVALVAVATSASAQTPGGEAGRIKVSSGAAFIVRGGSTVPAQAGTVIFEADALRTGADGRLGVTLKDDTRISLGPGSEVHVDRFVYAPAEARLGLVLKVVRGVMAYVSGRIAKLSPDAIRLETPAAVVGVRGTTLAVRVPE